VIKHVIKLVKSCDGFVVDNLPQLISIGLPDNGRRFQFTISQMGNKLNINRIFGESCIFIWH